MLVRRWSDLSLCTTKMITEYRDTFHGKLCGVFKTFLLLNNDSSVVHRPVKPDQYDDIFKHPSEEQGRVSRVEVTPLENERGRRQSWHYEVSYAGGETKQFCVDSPGLPVHFLSAIEIQEKLKTLSRQPF
jgi:hypothetical protein